MNKTLWNRNKVTKKQLALITSLNLWRKRGSNVNNMVVGVLSGHFQFRYLNLPAECNTPLTKSLTWSSWFLKLGIWTVGHGDSRMYLDERCHAPCTRDFLWNRQDRPIVELNPRPDLQRDIPQYKNAKKKVFCLQPFMKQLPLARSNSYYASWFTEIIVLLLGQSILLTSKYYTYLFCFWGKFLSEREEDQL